jgi:DNA-binding Lrp family transcriptional regulator
MAMLNEARAADGLPPLSAERASQTGQDRFVAELQSGPRSPKELIDASGMSPSWVRHILPKLIEYGAVRQPVPRGPYEAVPGMDLHEALEEIKRDRRRLEAGAREKATAGS